MELFDTHCHLDVAAFAPDRTHVLSSARQSGVKHILVPAIRRNAWQALWDLCAADAYLYPAIGLHPMMLDEHGDDDIAALADFIDRHPPLAIGEIGLDYAVKSLDRGRQQKLLEGQLEIAATHRLPVILHVRKAHEPMLKTLQRHDLPGGICHAFNGSVQQASRYREMGFYFGFGGRLTYPNARRLHELARTLPLDSIVLETDAPDMSGFRHRQQRNSPEFLPEVALMLAQLREVSPRDIAEGTTHNAFEALRLAQV